MCSEPLFAVAPPVGIGRSLCIAWKLHWRLALLVWVEVYGHGPPQRTAGELFELGLGLVALWKILDLEFRDGGVHIEVDFDKDAGFG